MQINHMNILYRLGWSHAKVINAMDILASDDQNKINKLMTETAPLIRATFLLSA